MSKLTLQQLESYLWESANILRGSIDSSDYKNYIFGILFLKRLNDVFEEEAERLEAETGDKQLAWEESDEHAFFVPERARWKKIREASQDIGAVINKANEALEERNPKLEGVLASIDYDEKERLPDRVLLKLVNHFHTLNLRNSNLSEPDILGRAYEYLIEQFADDAGKKGGEFYTPQKVVQLMVKLAEPGEDMRICDPCCGSGGMLVEAHYYVKNSGGNPQNITLCGQEKNLNTWAICKMNMFLHGIRDFHIEKGDTMLEPRLVDKGELMLFHQVIANPMWNQKEWGYEILSRGDPYGRFMYGLPSRSSADWAWIQHMLATTTDDGRVSIVLDNGVLFRGGAEGDIRRKVVGKDLVEAVIALPANLFRNTSSPGCILVFNKKKVDERKGKVVFIHAVNDYLEGKAQNFLRDEDVKKIVGAFSKFEDVDKYCRVADLKEIRENDYNLNVPRYVDIFEEEEKVDVAEVLGELRSLEKEREDAATVMYGYMGELGYE